MTFGNSVKKTLCWFLAAGYLAVTTLPAFADGTPRGSAPAPTKPAATSVVSRPAKPTPAAAQPAAKTAKPAVTSAKLNLHGPRDYDTFLQRMMISKPVADAYNSEYSMYTEDITVFLQNSPPNVKKQFTDLWVGAGIPLEDITRLFDGNYANGEATAITAKEYTGKFGEFYSWLVQVARGDSKVYVDNGLTVRDTHGKLEFKVFQSITNPEGYAKFISGLDMIYKWTVEHGRIAAVQNAKNLESQISLFNNAKIVLTDLKSGETLYSEKGHYFVPPGHYNVQFVPDENVVFNNFGIAVMKAQHKLNERPLASSNEASLEVLLDAGTKNVTVRKSNFWDYIIPFFRCTSLVNEKHPAMKDYLVKFSIDGASGTVVVTVVPPEYMERFGDKAILYMVGGYLLGKGAVEKEPVSPSSPFGAHGSSGGDGAIPR